MHARKSNYGSPRGTAAAPQTTATAGKKGGRAPYNLTFSVGDELVRLTGLFENTSKAGNSYLGVKKIRKEDAARLIEVLSSVVDGTEIGVFVFENKPKD